MDPWLIWEFDGGLVSSQIGPSLNGLSYTAQAIVCAQEGTLFHERIPGWLAAIRRCQVVPGLYKRRPNVLESTSVDDYLSLAACDPTLALEILRYGERTWGFFDVKCPNQRGKWATWLFRFPGLTTHIRFGARCHASAFGRFAWAMSVLIASGKPASNQDAHFQTSLMILTFRRSGQKSWLCEQASRRWINRLPKPVGQIFADYSGFPNHPLAKYWPELS